MRIGAEGNSPLWRFARLDFGPRQPSGWRVTARLCLDPVAGS